MRRVILGGIAALVVLAALVAAPMRGSAHALRIASVPDDGAEVATSPSTVVITFGEEPDPRLSSIEVLSTSGQQLQQGPTQAVPGNPVQLEVAVKPLPRGVYTVSWRTFSHVDGHVAGGAFAFGVGVSPVGVSLPPSVSGGPGGPTPADVVGRALLFLGLAVMVGSVGVVTLVLPQPDRRVLLTLPAAWIVAAAGTVAVVAAQAVNARAGLGDLFSTSIGRGIVERGVPLLIALPALALCLSGGTPRRRAAAAAVGTAAALAMLADVLNSHAAAGSAVAAEVALQWVHILAVGIWLGGLGALLLGIRGLEGEARGRAVRRFSTIAGVALVAVAATGTVRAAVEIGAWDRLWSTAFGAIVIAKASLLVVLAALGAVNRYRHVPTASRVVSGLRRVGTAELTVAVAALVLAAALVNEAPPASAAGRAAASTPPAIVLTASDYGTSVRVRLTVAPGTPGPNRFTASVTDYDSGAPVDAQDVQLTFTQPARTDLGSTDLTLTRTAPGTYAASGSNLSLAGSWQVTALVVRGQSSVEVPFTLTTRTPPPQPQTVRCIPGGGGLPTLCTVSLAQGGSLQVYLDPERPGGSEFHTTFFDTSGNGWAVTVTGISETPPGGHARTLPFRQLGPGHYVADATIAAGRNGFDVTGTSPQGQPISAHVDMTVKG
jgi:copper transport protein